MKKQKSEKSHFDMANRIYTQIKDKPIELFRLFRVYHPVCEISVNIETEQIEDHYHIIEKYMDKLVCGYIGENKSLGEGIFIKSKEELFQLLGIGQQAYEIAEKFYEDLIEAGHFEEIPGVGIHGLKPAHRSIKLEKRVNSATVKTRKLFDQFSTKLMPGQFYDFRKYACKRDEINEKDTLVKNSVWLEPNVTILSSDADIEQMMGNFNYVNQERIERGLPQGFQSMSIAKDEPIDLAYYPYYLAILKDGLEYKYMAFRVDNGQPIEWIGEQYRTEYYKPAVNLLHTLADISEKDVRNPIDMDFNITSNWKPDKENGVTKDENTGNYDWTVQDWQIRSLMGLDEKREFKRPICLMIANNEIMCLASYEAGKIVRIIKTDEQKKLLSAMSDQELTSDERKKLFMNYMVASEKQKQENSRQSKTDQIQREEAVSLVQKTDETKRKLTWADQKKILKAAILYKQKKYIEAMEIFVEFAEVESNSSLMMGNIYANGYGVSKDIEKAYYWYGISANLGNKYAQFISGTSYLAKDRRDTSKAYELIELSARQGLADAMYVLAIFYEKGLEVKKDEQQALIWYKKAIEAGKKTDYFNIAYLLHCGSEKVRDYKEAAKYYLLSVEEGNAAACCNLGVLYSEGKGVEKSLEKAIHYFELGTSRGSAMAMRNLAAKYEKGEYVNKDLKKALELYEKAAKKGNAYARGKLESVKAQILNEQK